MKKYLLITITTLLSLAARAQVADTASKAQADTSRFVQVDVPPEFPGGAERLFNYLAKNTKYPKEARSADLKGRVLVSFVIEKDGTIIDVRAASSLSPETDAEAIRVVKGLPKWKAGIQNGKPVRCRYTIPVKFPFE